MKMDVHVKNLGRIADAKIKVRDITVLAGPNGSGKSFFTKFLYSILHVVNKNVFAEQILNDIAKADVHLKLLKYALTTPSAADFRKINTLQDDLETLRINITELDVSSVGILNHLDGASLNHELTSKLLIQANDLVDSLKNKPRKLASIQAHIQRVIESFTKLHQATKKSKNLYSILLGEKISNTIKKNYQITSLQALTNSGKHETTFDMGDLGKIEIQKGKIDFSLGVDFINATSKLSSVAFFESPAYWKVRNNLIEQNRHITFTVKHHPEDETFLTGVPQYFIDLDSQLRYRSTIEPPEPIQKIANNLIENVGGTFSFKDGDYTFKEQKSGLEISKQLVSSGMTSLGMLHALLANNVITEGSFVFFDEPETNLHPNWQVLLIKSLISLAESGINIVIATHSVDILKALEVHLKQKKSNDPNFNLDDFASITYLNQDGYAEEQDPENVQKNKKSITPATDVIDQLIKARLRLTAAYEDLYIQEANLD